MYQMSTKDSLIASILMGIGMFVVISTTILIRNATRNKRKSQKSVPRLIIKIPLEEIFALIYISISMLIIVTVFKPSTSDESDISVRIEHICTDLSKTSSELSLIQQELEARIETVETLKAEAEIAENMISLSEDQVNAIQAKFHQEIDANSGKSLLQNILISSFFFFLGLFIKPIFHAIKKRFSKSACDDTSIIQTIIYSDEEIKQAIKLLDTLKKQETQF